MHLISPCSWKSGYNVTFECGVVSGRPRMGKVKYRSVPHIRPPFCNLDLSTNCRGAYTWDATISLAITPTLLTKA